jgi:hypothetical protein
MTESVNVRGQRTRGNWPDATLAGPRPSACLANERLRHTLPGVGMLTVAASSGHWRHSAAVTDGGGEADMRDAISA